MLLRILRELDADDARRVRRRDAAHLRRATPRRRRRAPVEAAREVPEHGSAPREAVPSDADERTALRRPAARRERADTVRALVLKVRTARRELVPIGRHLDSNVPRRARARRANSLLLRVQA